MNRRVLYNRASADPQGRPWSERKKLVWWDPRQGRVDGPRRAGLRGDQAAGLPPAGGRGGCRGAAWRRPVHHAGRRQGLAVRAQRPARRSAAHALRAARVAVPQCVVRTAGQPDAQSVWAGGQSVEPLAAGATRRGVPVRVHHLAADRAPHRGRDEPTAAVSLRNCSRGCSSRCHGSWRRCAA